jgi:hypothetical protein
MVGITQPKRGLGYRPNIIGIFYRTIGFLDEKHGAAFCRWRRARRFPLKQLKVERSL